MARQRFAPAPQSPRIVQKVQVFEQLFYKIFLVLFDGLFPGARRIDSIGVSPLGTAIYEVIALNQSKVRTIADIDHFNS